MFSYTSDNPMVCLLACRDRKMRFDPPVRWALLTCLCPAICTGISVESLNGFEDRFVAAALVGLLGFLGLYPILRVAADASVLVRLSGGQSLELLSGAQTRAFHLLDGIVFHSLRRALWHTLVFGLSSVSLGLWVGYQWQAACHRCGFPTNLLIISALLPVLIPLCVASLSYPVQLAVVLGHGSRPPTAACAGVILVAAVAGAGLAIVAPFVWLPFLALLIALPTCRFLAGAALESPTARHRGRRRSSARSARRDEQNLIVERETARQSGSSAVTITGLVFGLLAALGICRADVVVATAWVALGLLACQAAWTTAAGLGMERESRALETLALTRLQGHELIDGWAEMGWRNPVMGAVTFLAVVVVGHALWLELPLFDLSSAPVLPALLPWCVAGAYLGLAAALSAPNRDSALSNALALTGVVLSVAAGGAWLIGELHRLRYVIVCLSWAGTFCAVACRTLALRRIAPESPPVPAPALLRLLVVGTTAATVWICLFPTAAVVIGALMVYRWKSLPEIVPAVLTGLLLAATLGCSHAFRP